MESFDNQLGSDTMTSSRRYSVIGKFLGALALIAAGSFAACNNSQGNTDGGSAVSNLGTGNIPVSDGGFGAKLSLSINGVPSSAAPTLSVGDITEFTVFAQDPRGQGLKYQRVFCESEKGIAIIEPSLPQAAQSDRSISSARFLPAQTQSRTASPAPELN